MNYNKRIAQRLNIHERQVAGTVALLDEGATVPFISRYRKEVTGSLDDLQVGAIRDELRKLRELDSRRDTILKSIEEQEKLTPELKRRIEMAETISALEDLYLPFRPKRKTRASIAREKGLEPLALKLLEQRPGSVSGFAGPYVDLEKSVKNEEEALQGARDIMAEMINEDVGARESIRTLFRKAGLVTSSVLKNKKDTTEAAKYKDYFDWSEPLTKIPSHRMLAIRRGANEGILSFKIEPPEQDAIAILERQFLKASGESTEQVRMAIHDGYKRLMSVSMETEMRLESKEKADQEAIAVFVDNLRQLLMAAPLGQKAVMAIDPGFRTGCKLVCLDNQGKLTHHTTIFPNEPQKKQSEAGNTIRSLVAEFDIQAIAIGNGTAGRETESFVRSLQLPESILIVMVNESGASIYSASAVAREEFPDKDVTVRGAVSIGRRLKDPLAELVKIDAKSIGVGQYQHDVDQTALRRALDDVVMSCVNNVGVELNTASKQLLTYVSGLGPQIAENIVAFRNNNGAFRSRDDLKKVPRLGDKAFEQAAGFLRIHHAPNPLDRSAVHPERYDTVTQMAIDQNTTVADLMRQSGLRKQIDPTKYVREDLGLPTLRDILKELEKPGRDPRDQFEAITFQEGVNDISDLKTGMHLPGVVTNITKFGAFVDVGVHQDGLVHISHLSDRFVEDPAKIVKLGQKVHVRVLEVDVARKRISLSMKKDASETTQKPSKKQRKSGDDMQSRLSDLKKKWR